LTSSAGGCCSPMGFLNPIRCRQVPAATAMARQNCTVAAAIRPSWARGSGRSPSVWGASRPGRPFMSSSSATRRSKASMGSCRRSRVHRFSCRTAARRHSGRAGTAGGHRT
jgi:hypothetical protein